MILQYSKKISNHEMKEEKPLPRGHEFATGLTSGIT